MVTGKLRHLDALDNIFWIFKEPLILGSIFRPVIRPVERGKQYHSESHDSLAAEQSVLQSSHLTYFQGTEGYINHGLVEDEHRDPRSQSRLSKMSKMMETKRMGGGSRAASQLSVAGGRQSRQHKQAPQGGALSYRWRNLSESFRVCKN